MARARAVKSLFEGNNASAYGGGIFSTASNIELDTTKFKSNVAQFGAALALEDALHSEVSTKFSKLEFEANTATVSGGAIYLQRGVPKLVDALFKHSHFVGSHSEAYGTDMGSSPTRFELLSITIPHANTTNKAREEINVYPGQEFDVSYTVYDAMNNIVKAFPGFSLRIISRAANVEMVCIFFVM